MAEYQKAFQTMLEQNKQIFDQFKEIHDGYTADPSTWKGMFNDVGGQVVDIIRDTERKLCATMGKGQYSKFTQNLSDKFWNEVRKVYPKIDFVGVK